MSFFLKVVFACLIAIGIAAILAVVAAVVFFKKLCAEGFTEDTPYAIHLNEDLHPEWLEKPKAKNLIAELQQSGFTAGKAYVIDELNYAKLHSYFNGDYAAVVYEIEVLGGCFFDLVHFGKDDFAVTVSTMPTAGDFEMPPNKLIFGFEQLTIKEGLEILDENCRNRESIVLNNENFRETFEHYYRQEQIFRNRNGGISYEEFKKITQNKTLFKGKKFKEDKLPIDGITQALTNTTKKTIQRKMKSSTSIFFSCPTKHPHLHSYNTWVITGFSQTVKSTTIRMR